MTKSTLSSKLRSSSPADMAAGEANAAATAAAASKVRESMTISTQDSLEQSMTEKKSKRGSKKKSSKKSTSNSLEESLSELAIEDTLSRPKHGTMDDPTVATTDSRERNKKAEKKESKTRRGAKKQRSPLTPLDLETSLTELLTDEEEPASPTVRESLTINTLDSLDMDSKNKKKSNNNSSSSSSNNSSSGSLRRGTKKPSTTSLSSVLGKLDAPKDFGRDCDDNDTFCGLGTVGEKELARGAPHFLHSNHNNTTKQSSLVKKTKIVSPAQHKKNSKSTSSTTTGFGNRMMIPSHDSDSEEEDLFESFESNPFRVPYH